MSAGVFCPFQWTKFIFKILIEKERRKCFSKLDLERTVEKDCSVVSCSSREVIMVRINFVSDFICEILIHFKCNEMKIETKKTGHALPIQSLGSIRFIQQGYIKVIKSDS